MSKAHSGSGSVKSAARKQSLASYRSSGRREKNRDRRMARIIRGFRGVYRVVLNGNVFEFKKGR